MRDPFGTSGWNSGFRRSISRERMGESRAHGCRPRRRARATAGRANSDGDLFPGSPCERLRLQSSLHASVTARASSSDKNRGDRLPVHEPPFGAQELPPPSIPAAHPARCQVSKLDVQLGPWIQPAPVTVGRSGQTEYTAGAARAFFFSSSSVRSRRSSAKLRPTNRFSTRGTSARWPPACG